MDFLQKPTRVTLSSQVVRQMETCINRGIWPVDSKIPGEMELMERFGVSRNTVREATMSLVHAGLLRSQPGDGTYVISRNRMDAAMVQKFRESNLKDVLEVRLSLEVDLVSLACRRSNPEDLEKLKAALDSRQDSSLSIEDFVERDGEFHIQLAKQSHNALFYDLYRSCMSYFADEINTYLMSTLSDSSRQNAEHEALYHAVAKGNEQEAVQLIQKLIEEEREELSRAGLLTQAP